MLATWPAAPAALPELGAAPYFLPSTEVPARAVELSTIDWSPSQVGPSHFIQEFEVAAGEMLATVDTVTDDKSAPPAGATEVTVGAWPQAYVSTDGDSTTVRLVEPPGLVDITVAGAGDTARVALAVAAALERRPTGDVGWQLAAATTKEGELVQPALPLSEGWAHGWQQRVTKWIGDDGGPLAVMIISVGQPHLTSWTMLTTPATAVDSLPTGPAVSQLIDGRGSLVAWSPQVGVTVTVMTRESVTDTVELASSLHVVSEQAWSAAGVLLPSRSEVGCDYFLNPC